MACSALSFGSKKRSVGKEGSKRVELMSLARLPRHEAQDIGREQTNLLI